MKYHIEKKLFWIPIIITVILLGAVLIIQGRHAFTKSAEVNCPIDNPQPTCNIQIGKQAYHLQRGEQTILNDQSSTLLKVTNLTPWALMLLILIYNHFKYNKNYGIKQLKKLIELE